MNNYPVPGHTGDHRISLDLVTDVRAVLVKHGYPEPTYDDLNLLRAMLARFVYAPYTAAGAKAAPPTAAGATAGGGVQEEAASGDGAGGAVERERGGPSGVTRVGGLEADTRGRVRRQRAVVRGVAGGHGPTVR
jgi:hypothetical protein